MIRENRVFITGYGAVSPYGFGVEKMFEGLYNNRSTVINIKDRLGPRLQGINCQVAAPLREPVNEKEIPRKYRRNMGPVAILAYRACADALAHASIPEDKIGAPDLGIVFSSSSGSPSSLEESFKVYLGEDKRILPSSGTFFQIMSHTCSANVAHILGIKGLTYSVNSACASSTQAIGVAYELLKTGRQEIIVCGGAEELHPLVVTIFDLLQAASWSYNDKPMQTPRPFDSQRDGTVCGEGAGALVLETEESVKKRRARVFGEIIGYNTNIDPISMAQSSKDAIVSCIKGALDDAGLRPEQIDYINAHATATLAGDVSESMAIAEVFDGLDTPVSSLKGHMGHTLAACGALEMISSLEMMRREELIPSLNFEKPAPETSQLSHVARSGQKKKLNHFMKNSFAFGGVNAVLIVKEPE